jgi:hypothetical protein
VQPVGGWFERLFTRDRRQAKRHTSLPLVAYYWDGAEPVAHGILDASLSGLYLLTKQRWYPGTVVTVTLQRARAAANDPDRSIAVNAKVVRSGSDGVGLAFMPSPPQESRGTATSAMRAADTKTLQRFFDRVNTDRGRTA